MGFIHLNTIVAIFCITTFNTTYGQFFNRKPWPTYSLHNMPRTSFSCHDKILGGYYADSETQCQMFHVCVKVAGVGVQDFRFLCPNGTAFDQEAQICADWGDVDCEQATLYYSSDNFDLYRIGSGFENKRAPLAEEEEATFHLQRAETSDARRSKQTIINQSVRPEQPPIYQENTERNYVQQQQQRTYNDQFQYQTKKPKEPTIQKPTTTKKSYYQKSNNENQYSNVGRNNNHNNEYQSDSRNDDELLKGSHSSNFFNNRNNGKEDDLVEFTKAPTTIKRPVNRGRQRIRNPSRQNYESGNNNNIPTPPTKTTTTTTSSYQEPRINEQQQKPRITAKSNTKTLTLQTSFRTAELHQYDTPYNFRNSTTAPPITTTTTQRYNLTPTKPQAQQNIQPTTYNPSFNPYRIKSTTNFDDYRTPRPNSVTSTQAQNNGNPFYNVQYEKAAESNPEQFNRFSGNNKNNNDYGFNDDLNKYQTTTQNYNNFAQKKTNNYSSDFKQSHSLGEPLARRNDDQFSRQAPAKNTNYQNNFDNNNYQISNNANLPLTVRPLEARRVNAALTNQTNYTLNTTQTQNNGLNQQQQFYEPQINNRAFPTPFAKATTNLNTFQQSSSPVPRGFSYDTTKTSSSSSSLSTGTTQSASNNRYQKVSRGNNENYIPSTTPKKFSTLVPKDQYYPTTFKPATYKKPINGYNSKNDKPANINFAAASYLPTTSTSTSFPLSQTEADEDDGQYHPELYERDFPRNKIQKKPKQRVTSNSQTTRYYQTPSPAVDFGDEEEFLKPAHSLNIAVGANQLRAEKAEKAKQQHQQQQQQSSLNSASPHRSSTTLRTTHTITTTSRPTPPPISSSKQKSKHPKSKQNEDASYDYAYYDTGSENPHDYAEYDVISEFGKTKKHK